MAASASDKAKKAYQRLSTTLASDKAQSASSMTLSSAANWPTDTGVIATVYKVDANNDPTTSTIVSYKGTISGSTIANLAVVEGTDQLHNTGDKVTLYFTATHWNDLLDFVLQDHSNPNGYHKNLTDANGNEWIKQTATASAKNEFTVANAATGNGPTLSATGDDTNIDINITPKGTGGVKINGRYDGWVDSCLPAPNTITYNGNRSYDLVFNSVDYTDRISEGMRLKLTRTAAAPTQCTSLNGSSQYYSKSSPNKLTFTTTYTCMAQIKPSAYQQGGIISRHDGSTGWILYLNASGQVVLYAQSAGGARTATSYQSVPLNKWSHVAASWDLTGGTSAIYIDGVSVPTLNAGTAITSLTQAGSLNVGAWNGSNFFAGKIAQAAVFSAVIAATTIRSYISQGLSGSETNLDCAYSFNNSITDLNTTTPNDLTAQGSAVATTVDSPFTQNASGTPTGTTDYGIVMNSAFSTNTTLTVQVPEGCMIPTSGGVSAVSYSTQKSPYGFRQPSNILSEILLMSTFSSTTVAGVDVSGLTTTITPPTGRKIKVSGKGVMFKTGSAGDTCYLSIQEGSTFLACDQFNMPGSNYSATLSPSSFEISPTSGPHTYKLYCQGSAAGTMQIAASTTVPAYIRVEVAGDF